MPYKKGNHCNNCANAIFDSVTVYEGYQFGESVIYCADRPEREYSRPVYNCRIYRAANTACTTMKEMLCPTCQPARTKETAHPRGKYKCPQCGIVWQKTGSTPVPADLPAVQR